MTTIAGSGDAWRITGEDRAKHDAQFFSLKPVNGFITGEQARGFFMQSGIPTPVLGQIWGLADMNNDGKMDKKEFSIAMHLIKKKLQGYELPKSLPASLKADPSPVIGSFGTVPAQPGMMGMATGMIGMAPPMPMLMGPMMTNGMPHMVAPHGYMGAPQAVPVSAGYTGAMPVRPAVPVTGGVNLSMPHQSKLKYTQIFNSNDRNKKGSLTGVEARAILMQTGVPQQMLAQIWTLSDVDKDGRLDCEEFCIAMHLIDMLKMGQPLPVKLPPELIPGKVRSGSFGNPATVAQPVVAQTNTFGDLLGSVGMPPPVQPTSVANGETKQEELDVSLNTFEDKRKMNFDKGQAELERRRQMLQDQMRKENEERLDKERKEQEKREKQRLDQEMKRQQEMERQLEKQRQIERQREEQRQKMMDQRESARRELERQRQMEWERQRKEQLMAEKMREYEQLSTLKSQSSNLQCELESLQGKKTEMSTKISQVKNGVTDFTAHIEAMRSTRDLKNKDINRFQRELQELNQKLSALQSERQTLDLRVQTSIQSNPMSETHRTMMHSVELKKTSVQRLKKDLEQTEKETETKLSDFDVLNKQLGEMKDKLSKAQTDISQAEKNKQDASKIQREEDDRIKREKEKHEKLRKELEAQRLKEENQIKQNGEPQKTADSSSGNWFAFGGDTTASTTTTTDNWASVFDSQPSKQASTEAWGAGFSSQSTTHTSSDQKSFKLTGSKHKFKAMYQFDSRNEDELSLSPGDIVMVFDDQSGAEPGWKGGEMHGKCGWFPEAYVEKIVEEESSQSLFGSTDLSAAITSSEDSSFKAVPGKMPAVSPTPGLAQTAPAGLQAQALYPWKAKKDNHLTFNKGDVIHVREQQDMWWSGELNGNVGWFPKSYVKLISGPRSTPVIVATDSPHNSPSMTPTGTMEKFTDSARQSPALDKTAADTYIAVYPYQSTEPGDLTFSVGEVIVITKMDGDWWTGTLGGRTGIFPANYVKKQEAQFAEAPGLTTNTSHSSFADFDSPNPVVPGSPFTEDPFSESNQGVSSSMNSPFPEDPFGDSNTGTAANTVTSPFTEDPFGNADQKVSFDLGEGLSGDPFKDTSDPFSDSDPFASSSHGLESQPESSAGQTGTSTSSDPYAAFAGLNDQTDSNSFPDPPSGWLESLENDSNSIPSDLGSLTSGVQVPTSSCDSSIQTSGSFTNLDMFGSSCEGPLDTSLGSQAQNIKSSARPMASLMGSHAQNASSSSPLDDLMGLQAQTPKSIASPLDDLMGLQAQTPKSISSPLDDLMGLQAQTPKSIACPLDDLMGLQAQTPKSIASPLDDLMGLQAQSPKSIASPLDDLMGLQAQTPKSIASPLDDLIGLKTKPERPPLPEKTTRVRGGSLNKPGLDPGGGSLPNTDDADLGSGTDGSVDGAKLGSTGSAGSAGSTGTLKKPEIATVIAAYTATGEEQLCLSPGQLIHVRKKSPSGWWEGELQARGQKRKIGWFPANYVKLLGASARSTPDNTLTSGGTPPLASVGHASATPSPAPVSTTPQPTTQKYVDHVIAIYPYMAQNPDELTFQKDAVINVIKKDDPDWWHGEYNGHTGMFPSNYVQNMTPESTSWSNDPQVLALTSSEEGKRQSYIHELINTEESYMQDMSIVLEAFYNPIAESKAITEDELLAIFVNWKDLIVCNTKLQKALRVRKKMCGVGQVIISIGDILVENIPHLTPYIRFCSCQLNAAALLQRLTENNPRFTEIHKKCVQNPKTKGMPLSSFLLKPMQRITKYPLIVEKILKYTPESHPDHNHLQEALERCQEMCSQVNEGVREKENSDRLEWIQQHVHCDGLPEKITFNSGTNCLGPRKLLHTGVLCKSKSNKELAAFLFNDFLLLTTSNRPLSSATHSVFDVTGQVQYKMYKSPIFLNEVMVKKPNVDDSETFQICHIEHIYNLKAHSLTDRDTWVKRLDTASRHYLDTERKKKEKAISSPKSSRGVGRLLVIIIEGSNLICSKDVRRSPGVGRLLVVIIEGMNLQACDDNGKSDPYCEVSMGAQEHKTKVISSTLSPKWNASMQFSIRDVDMDTLCITVFDRDLFSPNDFLGRTEIRISDIMQETTAGGQGRRPIIKHLLLHEVPTGEVRVKLDLHLFEQT